MDVLLREVREQPNGAIEYQDSELATQSLSVGSAADQQYQLLGRAVAPRHFVIERSGSAVKLTCASGHHVAVNGKTTRKAALHVGDEIELSGHRLRVIAAPSGFDLAIEVHANENIDASEFEGAFRTDLQQTWLRKRALGWSLLLIVVVLTVASPLVGRIVPAEQGTTERVPPHEATRADPLSAKLPWLPSDKFWSSGPLHPAHRQVIGERCDACHVTLTSRVADNECRTCHTRIVDHFSASTGRAIGMEEPTRCASCHREHNEPASFLTNSGDGFCVDCHGGAKHAMAALGRSPVAGFGPEKNHPQFQPRLLEAQVKDVDGVSAYEWIENKSALQGAVERSNLKFTHATHLTRTLDGRFMQCADCHRIEPEGEHFAPIKMVTTCASSSCHDLTFDPGPPRRMLPHPKTQDIVLAIRDFFTQRTFDPGPSAPQRRRMPGEAFESRMCSERTAECAAQNTLDEVERQFGDQSCGKCHTVIDTHKPELVDRFEVVPVRLQRDYFPFGQFDHASHEIQGDLRGDDACLTCHQANRSDDSADLMIPGIAQCVKCHSDAPKVKFVMLQCVSCHDYHPHRSPSAATENSVTQISGR